MYYLQDYIVFILAQLTHNLMMVESGILEFMKKQLGSTCYSKSKQDELGTPNCYVKPKQNVYSFCLIMQCIGVLDMDPGAL